MATEDVEFGLVVVQVMIVEEMDFVVGFARTVDKEKVVTNIVVDMVAGMVVEIDFHKHILANLVEKVGFGSTEEDKSSKA
jgi:hypothetical protein